MTLPAEPDDRPIPNPKPPARSRTVDSDGNIRYDQSLEGLENDAWRLEQDIRNYHQDIRGATTDAEETQLQLDDINTMIAAAKAGRR